jgi:hypothetical protein
MSVYNRQSVQQRSVTAAMLSDLGPGMHPRISIRGGSFALVDAAGMRYGAPVFLRNTPQGQRVTMLGVIIGSNPKKSRVFYAGPYDPDNPGPPDCFSDNGIAASANASEPQARTCSECEWQKWGSDTSKLTGKKTKACDEKKKIAVIIVGDTTGQSYELQIPPATLKKMATYAATLAQGSPPGESRKADVSDMVTAFSFVPGQTGLLDFEPFAWLTSAYIDQNGTLCVATDASMAPLMAQDQGESVGQRIDDIWESNELDGLLGLNDKPWSPPALSAPLPGMSGYQAGAGALQAGQAPAAVTHATSHPAPLAQSPYAPPNPHAQPAQPHSPFAPPAPPPHAPGAQQAAPSPPANVPATTRQPRKPRAAAGSAPAPQAAGGTTFQPQGDQGNEIPNFLRRSAGQNPAAPAGQTVQPGVGPAANPTPNGGASYGMVEAGAPPSGIENVLDAAFKLNTTRT